MRHARSFGLLLLGCLPVLGCSESANNADGSAQAGGPPAVGGAPSAMGGSANATSTAAAGATGSGAAGMSSTPQGGTAGMGAAQSMGGTQSTGGAAVAGAGTAGAETGGSGATAGAGTGGGGATGGGGGASGEDTRRELLSQTGLFADIATETLADGVMEYSPQFQLYTDGATKRRWVYIPPGEQIDTSNIDEWKFPVGTKLWKEFSRDGVRVETRLIEKLPQERADEGFEGWLRMPYIWNDDMSDAVATPMGMSNARGTEHDVPDQEACGRCHDMRVEKPLGFSAVQLSHDGPGATLDSLLQAGILSDPPPEPLVVPGDEQQRAVLGYFHANCGHCHRKNAPVNNRVTSLRLWLESDSLGSFEETETYRAIVNQPTQSGQGSILYYRALGGDPDNSEIMRRITLRAGDPELADVGDEVDVPMPPLGTELVDDAAVEMVREFILSLPPPADAP